MFVWLAHIDQRLGSVRPVFWRILAGVERRQVDRAQQGREVATGHHAPAGAPRVGQREIVGDDPLMMRREPRGKRL